MNIVQIKNLNKIYKETDIFKRIKNGKEQKGIKNISFFVKKGEVFSIIGLNGAGKTTIMKSLLGLLDIDSGEVDIFNRGKLSKNSLIEIGYLPEISYYPKSIKLEALMDYYAELLEIKDKKNSVKEALEKVGLYERRKSRLEDFSKGMLQKVGIAQSIMNKPKLLFLDEPMSGLDPLARSEVIKLITELKKKGTTIFLNTHILDDIEKIGDRGIIVHNGEIIDNFNLNNLRDDIKYRLTFENGEFKEVDSKKSIKVEGNIVEIEKVEFSLEDYFRRKLKEREENEEIS